MYGCQGWSRTIQWVAGFCAALRTSGTSWSWWPSAEIAPEIPRRTTLAAPIPSIQPTVPCPRSRMRARPQAASRVTAIAPSRKKVETAWTAIPAARSAESLLVTQPFLTRTMPTSPSIRVPSAVATTALRPRWPFGKSRKAHRDMTRTSGPRSSVVQRCDCSMRRPRLPLIGVEPPSQRGQREPQPSPDIDARTNTPHATAAKV